LCNKSASKTASQLDSQPNTTYSIDQSRENSFHMLDHSPSQDRSADKSKVTLYLSPDTHRQLKIRSAVEGIPMYTLAEKAISFYLAHSDIVEHRGYGHTHQLHSCPQCAEKLVFRNGELVSAVVTQDYESTRDLILSGSST
jgi:hypothetical protein